MAKYIQFTTNPPSLNNISIKKILPNFARFIIQDVFKLTEGTNYSVSELATSEVRIFLLYSTQVKRPYRIMLYQTVTAAFCSASVCLFQIMESQAVKYKKKLKLSHIFFKPDLKATVFN